ncbi:MAG: ornithine carbamoyltransferase [Nitrospinae bacterium]|nr:ornithine carbamoyltransferase [Nitrospinota bacterium]
MPEHFLKISDHSPEALLKLVQEAVRLKKKGDKSKPLAGKTVALYFAKSSTRTRVAFQAGIFQMGGFSMLLRKDELQLGRGESHHDTAKVLSRYVDALIVRTYGHEELEEFAGFSSIPVINALTDKYHPCQAVADYAVLLDKKKGLKGLRLAYVGDGNNVANSLMLGGAMLGVNVAVATPKGYAPPEDVVETARRLAKKSGVKITLTHSPEDAAKGADALYTDVWASMGHESQIKKRKKDFAGFMVDAKLLRKAKPGCSVMHCLPAHRGEEISSEVMDCPASIVFDQAEYKLHAQKAILKMCMGGGKKWE